jgi:hypothetical protein
MKTIRYYIHGFIAGICFEYLKTKEFIWLPAIILAGVAIQFIWDITRKENN